MTLTHPPRLAPGAHPWLAANMVLKYFQLALSRQPFPEGVSP